MNAAILSSPPPVLKDIAVTSINTIRTLSIDAVQAADSGHPGTPMALAPLKQLQKKFGFTSNIL